MNRHQRRIAGVATALGLTVLASGAHATQGYFQAGFDAVQKSFAGGGVANSETATAIAINPAGLFDVGQQANVGLTFLTVWPEYSATDTGFIAPGSSSSNKNFYPLPVAAYSQPLDADNAVGLAIYGNGGMGTTYNIYNPNTKSGGVFGGESRASNFCRSSSRRTTRTVSAISRSASRPSSRSSASTPGASPRSRPFQKIR